jgi:tetratricopeptide (TPR) repeat protein
VNALRRAIELKPGMREAWYAVATALMRLGDAEEGRQALDAFQRLQREAMDEERRLYEINELKRDAVLQAAQGQNVQAAALWRKVVDRQPGVMENLVNFARALVKAGQRQAAIDVYARALALNAPLSIRRELVATYAALGNVEEGRKAQAAYEHLKEERLRRLGVGR